MDGYFARVIARESGMAAVLRPAMPSRFEQPREPEVPEAPAWLDPGRPTSAALSDPVVLGAAAPGRAAPALEPASLAPASLAPAPFISERRDAAVASNRPDLPSAAPVLGRAGARSSGRRPRTLVRRATVDRRTEPMSTAPGPRAASMILDRNETRSADAGDGRLLTPANPVPPDNPIVVNDPGVAVPIARPPSVASLPSAPPPHRPPGSGFEPGDAFAVGLPSEQFRGTNPVESGPAVPSAASQPSPASATSPAPLVTAASAEPAMSSPVADGVPADGVPADGVPVIPGDHQTDLMTSATLPSSADRIDRRQLRGAPDAFAPFPKVLPDQSADGRGAAGAATAQSRSPLGGEDDDRPVAPVTEGMEEGTPASVARPSRAKATASRESAVRPTARGGDGNGRTAQ